MGIAQTEPENSTQADEEPTALADTRGTSVDSIEIAEPVTISGIWADLLAHTPPRAGRSWSYYVIRLVTTTILSSGFHMMVVFRIGALMHKLRLIPLSIIAEKIIYHLYHCVMPCSARLGPGIWVPHPLGIVLNSRARLGAGVWLRQGAEIVHVWEEDKDKSGLVGDRAQLNSGCILLKGAVVGHDSIVAARALVTKVVPPGHIAVGIPAKFTPLKPDQFPEKGPRWA